MTAELSASAALSRAFAGRGGQRKVLFFEKKNQKTFSSLHTRPTSKSAACANGQKFFGSFFQKITVLLPVFLA
jgi:hypothetical protein